MIILHAFIAVLAFFDLISLPSLWRNAQNRFNFKAYVYYGRGILLLVIFVANATFIYWCMSRLINLISQYHLAHYQQNLNVLTQNEIQRLKHTQQYTEFMKKTGNDEAAHNWQLRERKEKEMMTQSLFSSQPRTQIH